MGGGAFVLPPPSIIETGEAKVKLHKIAHPQFDSSFKTLLKMPGVPAKSMFALRGVAKMVAEEMGKYQETRKAVVDEFAERDANGNYLMLTKDSVKIKPDKIKEMDKKLIELGDMDVKLPEIKYSDLGDAPTLNSEDLYHLEFIVE